MTRITMNCRLSSAKFQEALESGINHRRDVRSVGKNNKSPKKVFFIDDLSCVPNSTDAVSTGYTFVCDTYNYGSLKYLEIFQHW